MSVTLESRLRQMQVFNLDHASYCRGKCACSRVPVVFMEENPRTGVRAPRQGVKRVPAALTLLALQRRTGLPAAVLSVPEIKTAIQRGHVRVLEQTDEDDRPSESAREQEAG